ncbi:MAG: helix-turn-helix domain-containing protein [Saprospiraceae bacterium]
MPAPSFDTWTSLFLLAAVQGLFVSTVFAWKLRQTRSPFHWLIAVAVLFSLTLLAYVLYWTGYQRYFPYLLGIIEPFPFLFGPFFYFYFRQVFTQQAFQRQDWLHLLPFLLYFAARLPMYFLFATQKMPSESLYLLIWVKMMPIVPWLKVGHMVVYALLIHWKFTALSRSTPQVRRWYAWLNLCFAGFILSYAAYFFLVRMPFFNSEWDYMVSFSMTGFIYLLAGVGYVQPQVFGWTCQPPDQHNAKYKNSGLTPAAAQQLQERLTELMEREKYYQDSELRLEKLADLLGTTRHHLSQVINDRLGQSFFDYINTLRIEEAKRLLATTTKTQMNVIEIAYQVGFNNKVSFNATFKKLTNLTPSQYRNLHIKASLPDHSNGQRATLQ